MYARPITTYGRRGLSKPGVLKRHHAVIYSGRVEPERVAGEMPGPGEHDVLPSIQVRPTDEDDRMDPMSRLNFGKLYTVEHNVRVFNYGMVIPDHIPVIRTQWKQVLQGSWPPERPDMPTLDQVAMRSDEATHEILNPNPNDDVYDKFLVEAGDESDEKSEVSSVFSAGAESSTSSISAFSMNTIQVMGVREITTALLAHEDLAELFTIAIDKVERRKVRAHFRGFLRQYGQNLLKEAAEATLAAQAAQFITQLAGRISDQICQDIDPEGSNERQSPETSKRHIEAWLSRLDSIDHSEREEHILDANEDTSNMSESDDEGSTNLQLPRIEKITGFLMTSEALNILVVSLKTWLRVDDNENKLTAEQTSVDEKDVHESTEITEAIPDVSTQPPLEHQHAYDRMSTPHGTCSSLVDIVTQGLDSWTNWMFPIYTLSLFRPPVPSGYRRLEWECVSQCRGAQPHVALALTCLVLWH